MDTNLLAGSIGVGLNLILKFAPFIKTQYEKLPSGWKVTWMLLGCVATAGGFYFLGSGEWLDAVQALAGVLTGAMVSHNVTRKL